MRSFTKATGDETNAQLIADISAMAEQILSFEAQGEIGFLAGNIKNHADVLTQRDLQASADDVDQANAELAEDEAADTPNTTHRVGFAAARVYTCGAVRAR